VMVKLNESFVDEPRPAAEGEDTASPAQGEATGGSAAIVQFRPAGDGANGGSHAPHGGGRAGQNGAHAAQGGSNVAPALSPALQGSGQPAAPTISRPNLPQPDVEEYENQPIETRPDTMVTAEAADGDPEDSQPVLIDTTAELLGRAKARKPRARAAARPAPAP